MEVRAAEAAVVENLQLKREIRMLEREKATLHRTVALLLRGRPALVIREDDLAAAPEIEIFENMGGEIVIRARKNPPCEHGGRQEGHSYNI